MKQFNLQQQFMILFLCIMFTYSSKTNREAENENTFFQPLKYRINQKIADNSSNKVSKISTTSVDKNSENENSTETAHVNNENRKSSVEVTKASANSNLASKSGLKAESIMKNRISLDDNGKELSLKEAKEKIEKGKYEEVQIVKDISSVSKANLRKEVLGYDVLNDDRYETPKIYSSIISDYKTNIRVKK